MIIYIQNLINKASCSGDIRWQKIRKHLSIYNCHRDNNYCLTSSFSQLQPDKVLISARVIVILKSSDSTSPSDPPHKAAEIWKVKSDYCFYIIMSVKANFNLLTRILSNINSETYSFFHTIVNSGKKIGKLYLFFNILCNFRLCINFV